jgi:hypothetical protein
VGADGAAGHRAGLIAVTMCRWPGTKRPCSGYCLGFWGALGDLFESMRKRSVG